MRAKPKSIHKSELIKLISKETGFHLDDVRALVENTFSIVRRQVAEGNIVFISRFGIFLPRNRKKRGNNLAQLRQGLPLNPLVLPEAKLPSFKPSKAFKQEVINQSAT